MRLIDLAVWMFIRIGKGRLAAYVCLSVCLSVVWRLLQVLLHQITLKFCMWNLDVLIRKTWHTDIPESRFSKYSISKSISNPQNCRNSMSNSGKTVVVIKETKPEVSSRTRNQQESVFS